MFLFSSPKKAMMTIWTLFFISLPLSIIHISMNKSTIIQWTLTSMNSMNLFIPIILDPTGMLFSSTVMIISASILQFSSSYMKEDPFIKRFTHLVLLFVMSMNLLIFIPHMMMLLLGWDGLGITSFVLVIYYQNPKSLAAGMITALSNRIGDVMILLAIAWSSNQGHWYIMLNSSQHNFSHLICLSITIAALTKSAQIPFSSWLPAAMAAPTPVSALVHSSTLVTAGVFLLIRFYPFLSTFNKFNQILLIISSMTMLMAGISAMMECDMKKIIALSTLSQLGVMMSSLALNLPNLTLFHLITHAMFKALLFLCAGNLININSHAQDLRLMGMLSSQTPMLSSSMFIANAALSGFPFLAGFYSKDMIIEMLLFNENNFMIITIYILATILTASYSIRFMISIMWSPNMSPPIHMVNDKDKEVIIPMMTLTSGAITSGSIINWMMILPTKEPFIYNMLKLIPPMSMFMGLMFSYMLCSMTMSNQSNLMTAHKFHHMNSLMWFLTPLSSQMMIKYPLSLSHKLFKIMDQGWNETMGGQGMLSVLINTSSITNKLQNNLMTSHILLSLSILIPIMILL